GLTIESATLIEGNFYWSQSSSCKHAIYIVGAWNNATGRSGLTIRDNIIIGSDNVAGIALAAVTNTKWESINVYNNTIYHNNDGIAVSNASANTVDVKNNVVIDSTDFDFAVSLDGGTFTLTNDYNDYWRSIGDIKIF